MSLLIMDNQRIFEEFLIHVSDSSKFQAYTSSYIKRLKRFKRSTFVYTDNTEETEVLNNLQYLLNDDYKKNPDKNDENPLYHEYL